MVASLLNLFSLTAIAISFIATPANAFSVDSSVHIARHQVIAKNARQISETPAKRCKARSTPLSVSSVLTTTPAAAAPTHTSPKVSTPTPAPAPAPASQGSGKAGIAWALGGDSSLKNFLGPKVNGIYSWSAFRPPNTFGLEFFPMLWGRAQVSDFTRTVVRGYANVALGFNEPELPSQSNIDPWSAATLWWQTMEPLVSQGYSLVTPAISSAPQAKTWMTNFLSACGGCHFSAMALHWYGTNPQDFINYVTDFHNTFGMNIWVTEFACQDFAGGPQADDAQIFTFMQTVTSWMEATPWVTRYFAFGIMHDLGNVNPGNALMDGNGNPTPLGWLYIG